MNSMYAKYLKEKTQDQIVETDKGFVTYRYLADGKTVYIVDIYVLPDWRQTYAAKAMADNIVEEARKKGCNQLLGSVVPSNKSSTTSVKVLLAYGMNLVSSGNDLIFFKKDI
jgi:hypothetical protein